MTTEEKTMPDSTIINNQGRITVTTGELRTVFPADNYMATAAVIGCLHDELGRLKAELGQVTTPRSYTCWCVFGPDKKPRFFATGTTREKAQNAYEIATAQTWQNVERRGYTVRRLQMTDVT